MIIPFWLAYILVRRSTVVLPQPLLNVLTCCGHSMGVCLCREKVPSSSSTGRGGATNGGVASNQGAVVPGRAGNQAALAADPQQGRTANGTGSDIAGGGESDSNYSNRSRRSDHHRHSDRPNRHSHGHNSSGRRGRHRSNNPSIDSLALETLALIRTLVDK